MRIFIRNALRMAVGARNYARLQQIADNWRAARVVRKLYKYDADRLLKFSGCYNGNSYGVALADIIAACHVVEKGLTMPNRRFVFGRSAVCQLMDKIDGFERKYGTSNEQVLHAANVVAEYYGMHNSLEHEDGESVLDEDFRSRLAAFCGKHGKSGKIGQMQTTRDSFYKDRKSSFDRFAWARHTLRHYSDKILTTERIEKAVELALSTPSACNRQYCRVHVVTDPKDIGAILDIQKGNRGFGHLANKLLVVTADLEGLLWARERNDLYTNGGMFLMNLCYSLYYHEIAHCVLNWSKSPEEDMALRRIVKIKESETVIALLTCGETPEDFSVAPSPRKSLADVLVLH